MDWLFYLLASITALLSLYAYSVDRAWRALGGPDRDWRDLGENATDTDRQIRDERALRVAGLAGVATILRVIILALLVAIWIRHGWQFGLSAAAISWILSKIPIGPFLQKVLVSIWLVLGALFGRMAIASGWRVTFTALKDQLRYIWTGKASPIMEAAIRMVDGDK